MSKAIILNGTSSSGKTSLAKALQKELDGPYLHCQMDSFLNMIYVERFPNEKLSGVIEAFMESSKCLLDKGYDVIIDTVFQPENMKIFLDFLKDHSVTTVAVKASLPILQQREKARGDREIGQAESQFRSNIYSFNHKIEIDTTNQNLAEASRILKSKLTWHLQ